MKHFYNRVRNQLLTIFMKRIRNFIDRDIFVEIFSERWLYILKKNDKSCRTRYLINVRHSENNDKSSTDSAIC